MPIIYNENVPLDNKQLRIYNEEGNFTRVSTDEAIASGYNKWKNWNCSAGVKSLYIDYDGNVWIGNCASSLYNPENRDWLTFMFEYVMKSINNFDDYHSDYVKAWENFENNRSNLMNEFNSRFVLNKTISYDKKSNYWGCLGNIYEKIDYPKSYIKCPLDSCGCGFDVTIVKHKNKEDYEKLLVTNHGYDGMIKNSDKFVKNLYGDQVAVELNYPLNYQILWDLGRRCNYDCSYCWPTIHNNVEKWKDFDIIIKTIDSVIDNWSNGNPIRWNFGGGEPTMHPNFLDIIKHLKQRNQWVMVVTNGSRSFNFWKEARYYLNSVIMSAHFDSMIKANNVERFIENCKLIMEYHEEHDDDHWIEIKLMTPPGKLDHAIDFKEKILSLNLLNKPGANGRMKGIMSLVPIRSIKDSSKLLDYSDNELAYFKEQ